MKQQLFDSVVWVLKMVIVALYLAMLIMVFAFVGILFYSISHNGLLPGVSTSTFSVYFALGIIIAGILLLFCYVRVVKSVRTLLQSISQNEIFISDNVTLLIKIGIYLILCLLIQILVNGLLNILEYESVSSLFDLSFRDYLFNLIFIMIDFVMIIVFKKGKNVQEENDEII